MLERVNVKAEQLSQLKALWDRYGTVESGHMPKHVALRAVLSAAIADGFWKQGEKLPTEAELAESSPYSLGTVQRAMRALVEQGVVERHRRKGTFVHDHKRQLDSPWHCRFLDDNGSSFLPVFTKVIERTVTDRHGPWSRPLEQGDQKVVRIDRRMEINSEFTVYSKFFVRADRFPDFLEVTEDELSGANLKMYIIRTLGLPLSTVNEQLRMAPLPVHVCDEIAVPEGTVGLHMSAVAYAGEQMPVYYQQFYIPPTERRLYIESRMPTTG